jgi:hypothetical protein
MPVVVIELGNPGDEEEFIVHRQAEPKGQRERRNERFDSTRRRKPQQTFQVTVLEDPGRDTERGPQRQDVEDERLRRDDDRSGHEE